MPYVNALVSAGDWSTETDKYPASKWMHDYTSKFDTGKMSYGKHHTSDFTYSKSTGQVFPPGQASYDQVVADYSFFTQYYHEPYFVTAWEREQGDGWELLGNAWLYVNLPGGNGDTPIKSADGRSWQMKVPGGFFFVYKRDANGVDGIKLASIAITSDSGPVVVELLKRGVMKPEMLMG